MQISGKWLIIFIFGTALAMAIFAWSFQYLRGRRVLELYGPDAARLIRVDADRVQLLQLGDAADTESSSDTETLELDNQHWPIVDTIDISRARGLLHARQALIEDSSYAWNQPEEDCGDGQSQWAFALRFAQGNKPVTIAFDVGCGRLRLIETGAEAPLAEHFVRGMQTFAKEQLPAKSTDLPAASDAGR
jgi:hypothetical protein